MTINHKLAEMLSINRQRYMMGSAQKQHYLAK